MRERIETWADWLKRRYGELLQEALQEAGRTGVNVEIVSSRGE